MAAQSGSKSATPGELYVRAMESTARYVAGVKPDQWHNSTPNTEWDVQQVVNHIVSENLWASELFRGLTIAEVGDRFDGDVTGDDPAGAYMRSFEAARTAVEAPGAMERLVNLSRGNVPGAEYARELFLDLLIHGWDIAKGTGQDARLDPALVEACIPIAEEITRQARSKGFDAYGQELAVGADADPQVRLLALVGRKP